MHSTFYSLCGVTWRLVLLSVGLLVLFPQWIFAQDPISGSRVVTGLVVDEANEPLAGAVVLVNGVPDSRACITDGQGRFSLSVNEGDSLLVVNYTGYTSLSVALVDGRTDYGVTLKPEVVAIEDVVITGYQRLSRDRTTGAFASFDPSGSPAKVSPTLVQRLDGQIAGLMMYQGTMRMRGVNSISAQQEPLVVLDGVPYEGRSLDMIKPEHVENVTILKDAAAASIYGARAANGVIVITTKAGAQDGKIHIDFSNTLSITPKPNYRDLNLISSPQLVALQDYLFQFYAFSSLAESRPDHYFINPVRWLMMLHRIDSIDDATLAEGLERYRNLDNRDQLEDFYLRTGLYHQHVLTLRGGNRRHSYYVSADYTGDYSNNRYSRDGALGFVVRDDVSLWSWLRGDVTVNGRFRRNSKDRGIRSYSSMLFSPSYYMLRDGAGNPIPWPTRRAEASMQSLLDKGLMDEHYSPINNLGLDVQHGKEDYWRINAGLQATIIPGLTLEGRFAVENTYSQSKHLMDKASYRVRQMVNSGAIYDDYTDPDNPQIIYHVPRGGQISLHKGDNLAYTLRSQLNYSHEWEYVALTALVGTEQRAVRQRSSAIYYMGYDDKSFSYVPVNPESLYSLDGTEDLSNFFSFDLGAVNYLHEIEDRFVSFYGNFSTTFLGRYNLTGSLRIDQSNLFGTNIRNQWRPLWSLGASWAIDEEPFIPRQWWLNRLNLRVTYGIGGNIPKDVGPYLMLTAPSWSQFGKSFASTIQSPPNPNLRWEKTHTLNLGLDFSLLAHRLYGGFDYYLKNTFDLLAMREVDPTLGFTHVMMNYGAMRNHGVELTLSGRPVDLPLVSLDLTGTFSYNKNRITRIENNSGLVLRWTQGNVQTEGKPYNAMYSFSYAGLDAVGMPTYYNAKGERVYDVDNLNDLVYMGPTLPSHAASFNLALRVWHFTLTGLFTYQGGHYLRYEAPEWILSLASSNVSQESLHFWTTPGDEADLSRAPAPIVMGGAGVTEERKHQWYAANRFTQRGDNIRLREIALAFDCPEQWLRPLRMERATLAVQVYNVALLWAANDFGQDPEALGIQGYGWGVRQLRAMPVTTVSLNISF